MRKACPLHGAESLRDCHNRIFIQSPLDINPLMNVCEEIACSLDVDLSSLPSKIRCTSDHLSSRHLELSKWQSLTAFSISRVGQEVDALEQLKLDVENQLEERQTYANFIHECVKFKEDDDQFVREDVYMELKKEQQLTNEIIGTLKNHIFILHGQIDSLRDIESHLLTDFQDKSQAINLTANCMTHSNLQQSPQTGPKRWPISYNEWKSKCLKLQNTSDNLLQKSTNMRGNVEFTLTNLKNAYMRQRSNTSKAMRKTIHDMKKKGEQTRWKLQQVVNEMDEHKKTLQRVYAQIRNCKARTIQNSNNLDTLNQRQQSELCQDQAYNSLTLQKCDLTLIAAGLEQMKIQVHTKMESVRRCIPVVQGELEALGRALQTELKCQYMYQNILPLHEVSVGPMNKGTGAVNFLEKSQG